MENIELEEMMEAAFSAAASPAVLEMEIVTRLFRAAEAADAHGLDMIFQDIEHDTIFHDIEYPDILARVNDEGKTACHVAVELDNSSFAARIVSIFPKILRLPDMMQDTPLHYALMYERRDLFVTFVTIYRQYVEQLPQKGREAEYKYWYDAVVNKEGKSLLYLAVEKENSDAVNYLLRRTESEVPPLFGQNGKGPDESTALHAAVDRLPHDHDILKMLLKGGLELGRHRDNRGNTPLHVAVFSAAPDQMIELLLRKDPIPPTILNEDGLTPVHLAVTLDRISAFVLFRRHCRNSCTKTTSRQQNVLHIALIKSPGILDLIVQDTEHLPQLINMQDADGNTPLHIASYQGSEKLNLILSRFDTNGLSVSVRLLKNKMGLTYEEVIKTRDESILTEENMRTKENFVKAMEVSQNSLLVMSTLITTVTFTAAFTVPGGYSSNEPDQGMAILRHRVLFKIFMLADAMSMCSSIIAATALIMFSMDFSIQQRFSHLKLALGAISVSLMSMLVAFVLGVVNVVGKSPDVFLTSSITTMVSSTMIFIIVRVVWPFGRRTDDHGLLKIIWHNDSKSVP